MIELIDLIVGEVQCMYTNDEGPDIGQKKWNVFFSVDM
jgi:hypothetical protein